MKTACHAVILLLLAGCGYTQRDKTADQAPVADYGTLAGACRSSTFEGSEFTVCHARHQQQTIATILNDKNGSPLRSMSALERYLGKKSGDVAFAVNAGMFDEGGKPIGYYVESGKRLKSLNRKEGPGNFHLLPNGVFFGTRDSWQIRTADDFEINVNIRPSFATQSGPMILIKGKLHPQIAANGESVNIRNAVGLDNKGDAHFVQSEVPVSFGRLARFMRDKLGCNDALYLDGTVSALWYPAGDRLDTGFPLGPLLVVNKTAKKPK
jgi:uncharacterized protein YigE (DUF2233 family)